MLILGVGKHHVYAHVEENLLHVCGTRGAYQADQWNVTADWVFLLLSWEQMLWIAEGFWACETLWSLVIHLALLLNRFSGHGEVF